MESRPSQLPDGGIGKSLPKRPKRSFSWIEVHLASHCNLRCDGCSHHSPFVKARKYEIGQFEKDLSAISEVAKVDLIWFVGGEPLLNPRISDFLAVSRKIGFSVLNAVATNGLLLSKMTQSFFRNVDYIFVSLYPAFETRRAALATLLRAKARSDKFSFNIVSRPDFYDVEVPGRLSDEEAQRSYDNCHRAHSGHFLEDGYFYKCMRPVSTEQYLRNRGHGGPLPNFVERDGVYLHEPNLRQRLDDYMESKSCLQSCYYCSMGHLAQDSSSTWGRMKAKLENIRAIKSIFYRNRHLFQVGHSIQDYFDRKKRTAPANKNMPGGENIRPHRLLSADEVRARPPESGVH